MTFALTLPSLTGITGLLLVIAGFSFLIFVHELGHFLVARWVNIKVSQFAIGIGPGIVAWRKGLGFRAGSTEPEYERRIREQLVKEHGIPEKAATESSEAPEAREFPDISSAKISQVGDSLGLSETEYRFNWLPLGGYVKMEGQEDMDPTAVSDDERAFNNKPAWARAAVISAGVIMNMIFAVIFFVIAFMAGVNFPAPEVGDVAPTGPAAKAVAVGHEDNEAYRGLQPGDRFIKINDEKVNDFADVSVSAGLARAGVPLDIVIDRDGEHLNYLITPAVGPEGLMWLGISPAFLPTLADTGNPESIPQVLRDAGVTAGMTITQINGRDIKDFPDIRGAINASGGQPIRMQFAGEADSNPIKMTLPPRAALVELEEDVWGLLGMVSPTQIEMVAPGSPAEKAGIQKDDVIVRLGSLSWPDPIQIYQEVPKFKSKAVDLEVWRDGKVVKLEQVTPRNDKIGVGLQLANAAIVGRTLPDSPAAKFRLPAGSRIVAIDNQPVETWADVQRLLLAIATKLQDQSETREAHESNVSMTFELNLADRPRETFELSLGSDQVQAVLGAKWTMGEALVFMPKEVLLQAETPWEAIGLGIHRTNLVMIQTYQTLARLVQGSVPAKALRGPVGIADIGTQIVTNKGWTFLMFFLGLISVNLAVLNFLPLPIVDGGLMVLLVIEKIKGSPVSPAVLTAANVIGLALLGSLFLFVTFHDISRLITGG